MQKRTVILHILIWLIFAGLHVFFLSEQPHSLFAGFQVSHLIYFVGFYAGLYYLHSLVLYPFFYREKKKLLYFFFLALLLAITVIVKPFDRILEKHGEGFPKEMRAKVPVPGKMPPPPQMDRDGGGHHLDIISIFLFFTVLAVGTLTEAIRQNRANEQKAALAEAEKAKAELSFLKAQINPHFMFNTLNNIYALAVKDSSITANSILKLSGIMRYFIDEASGELVPLESELECIRNYIELQKLRLTVHTQVDFTVSGSSVGKKIVPLIMMNFIENAFKHGVSSSVDTRIVIDIAITAGMLKLETRNTHFEGRKALEREGIGISNTRKRLDYYYAGSYDLKMRTRDGIFITELTINIK